MHAGHRHADLEGAPSASAQPIPCPQCEAHPGLAHEDACPLAQCAESKLQYLDCHGENHGCVRTAWTGFPPVDALEAARALLAQEIDSRMEACRAEVAEVLAKYGMTLDVSPATVVLRPAG